MKIINTGSPYYLTKTGLTAGYAMQVNIWLESSSDIPNTVFTSRDPDFTLIGTPINEECSIDISEYIKPSMYAQYNDPETVNVQFAAIRYGKLDTTCTNCVNFTSVTDEYVAGTLGYSYFDDSNVGEYNNSVLCGAVFNQDYLLQREGEALKLSVFPDVLDSVIFYNENGDDGVGNNTVYNHSYAFDPGNPPSYQPRQYVEFINSSNFFSNRVIGQVRLTTRFGDSRLLDVIQIPADSCQFTSKTLLYMNKLGGLSEMYFQMRSDSKLDVKRKNFTTNLGAGFSSFHHADRTYQMDSKVSETLNSDYYPIEVNDMFDELLLSKRVYLYSLADGYKPVIIKTSSYERLTEENSDLIQYTIEVEESNDKINRQ